MREIKFRGKNIDDGNWIYGTYEYFDENHGYPVQREYRKYHCIKHYVFMDFGIAGWEDDEIAVYTLGQYTGLKDWDEKEVFEGDIIQYLYDGCDENDQYIVEWDEENLQFAFKNTKKEEYMALEDMYDCDYGKHSIRVIGNIYDNPELIKE